MFTSLAQLTAIITLILECPGGLNILTGRFDPPTPEELYQVVESCKRPAKALGVKIDGGGLLTRAESITMLADTFERIVERFGGWGHIVEVTNQWIAMNTPSWRLIVDHHRWVKNKPGRLDGSQLERIAEKHGVSRETIWRLIKLFPGHLAEAIMRSPIEHREAV